MTFPIKHGDFPVRYVNVYQRVIRIFHLGLPEDPEGYPVDHYAMLSIKKCEKKKRVLNQANTNTLW